MQRSKTFTLIDLLVAKPDEAKRAQQRRRAKARVAQAGFTLIELLVVIAIIGILASLLLPALSRARYRAGIITCISQVRGMATGIQVYAGDYNNVYPDGQWGRDKPSRFYRSGTSELAYDFRDDFREYFGVKKLHEFMMCPLAHSSYSDKYPAYPNIDNDSSSPDYSPYYIGQSPYAFYFGQDLLAYQQETGSYGGGAHWNRSVPMVRVGDTWSPQQNNTDMKFNWLVSDFVYYNGYGGFGGTYMATTHKAPNGSSPPMGSYLDHNLGSRYLTDEFGNANFARDDGSVQNYEIIGMDAVVDKRLIGVRRQSTQSYFVPAE